MSIGLSLGSPIGCAISPARDPDPYLAYAFILPVKDKDGADWSCTWVPIITPTLAAVVTGALALAI